MKTVVSIDFDIIMGPNIEAYNNYAGKPWDEIFLIAPLMQYCNADLNDYVRLTNYLIKLTKTLKKEQIHIITEHHHILNFLPNNDTYTVYNIDHHHDTGYNDDKTLNCGNWGKELYNRNSNNELIWIYNQTSNDPADGRETITRQTAFRDSAFENITPDILVLCLSPQWVPPNYQSLFYLWLDLLNRLYDTHFDFED